MSLLLFIIVVLVVLALAIYFIRLIPGDANLKLIITALVVIVAILLILSRSGLFSM